MLIEPERPGGTFTIPTLIDSKSWVARGSGDSNVPVLNLTLISCYIAILAWPDL